MKRTNCLYKRRRVAAFTLIELLVVIAIIGILAALVFPVVGVVNKNKQISLAKTELQQIQQAIEGYHTKLGTYPPDNPNNVVSNQLYFELIGTTNDAPAHAGTAQTYVTLDGSSQASTSDLNKYFGVLGIGNTATRAHSDDTGSAASGFLTHLLPNQISMVDTGSPQVLILVCPVSWPSDRAAVLPNAPPGTNPWRYTSSHATNNTGSYDLWVDLVIRGKTNRVCNWSANPIQL
jgi:prepilin-type N-terminal cleavage/methylation domain-containing protein